MLCATYRLLPDSVKNGAVVESNNVVMVMGVPRVTEPSQNPDDMLSIFPVTVHRNKSAWAVLTPRQVTNSSHALAASRIFFVFMVVALADWLVAV